MIISKSNKYYRDKIRIDKAHNQKTSWKIKTYQNQLIDNYIKSYDDGVPVKPSPATMYGELAILNKPDVYNNYQKIINSKYTSDEAINNMLVKNKANKDLDRIVSAEVERIAKNVDWVEQVIHKYEVPLKEYNKALSEQASKSMANRQQILKDVAIKSNELLVSEGLNIPSNVFSYRDIEVSAESMLRQSQMTSNHELHQEINENYLADGKEAPYKSKRWVWTGAGATTRHESNNMQEVAFNDYFVVVNDNTLDIDMLMYPSDPNGSPSNVYICYCEVEYGNEEYVPPEFDTPSLQWTPQPATPEVTFSNKLSGLGGAKIFEVKDVKFESLKTNQEIADHFGYEYNPNGRSYEHIGGETFEFYDPKNNCTLRFFKDKNNMMNNVDFTNSGNELYNLKDLVKMYEEAPQVLKETVGEISFGVNDYGNGEALNRGLNNHVVRIYKNAIEEELMSIERSAKENITDLEFSGLKHTLYHEMAHCYDYNANLVNGIYQGTVNHPFLQKYYEAMQKDYEFQKANGYEKQDASMYGETDFTEDFAEMTASVFNYENGLDYEITSSLDLIKVEDPNARRGYYRRDQLVSEMIERNPNRYQFIKELYGL